MSKPKKPLPAFEMAFTGPGIYPELIPLAVLSRAFTAVQRLAAGVDAAEADEEQNPELLIQDGKIGLVQVRRGSAVYAIATRSADVAVSNLRETGRVLDKPEELGDREYMLSPLDELSAVCRNLDSPIVLKYPGRGGAILATILPGSYGHVSKSLLISGDTTIFGRVERVGGATEVKCALRLDNRPRLLFCAVEGETTARKLGEKLYERVSVKGTAHWLKTTWKVVRFTIRDVRQPRLKPVAEMIDALRNAGGSDWDKIPDPQAFLDEVPG